MYWSHKNEKKNIIKTFFKVAFIKKLNIPGAMKSVKVRELLP